jgi:hypothetical protein
MAWITFPTFPVIAAESFTMPPFLFAAIVSNLKTMPICFDKCGGKTYFPNILEQTAFGRKQLGLVLVNTKACSRLILSDLIVLQMCIYVLPECCLFVLILPVPLTDQCYCPYLLLYRRCGVDTSM